MPAQAAAPVAAEKVPAGQLAQEEAPLELEVPAAQGEHVDALVAPAVAEKEPAAQGRQVALETLPLFGLYVPCGGISVGV